jgi:hypothetical protein
MQSIKHFILAAFILGVVTGISRAQVDSVFVPLAYRLDSIAVSNGPSPVPGDTVHLKLWVHANVSGLAILHLEFPDHIAPPDQASGETERDSNILLDSGSAYNYILPLKLFSYGGSHVSFTVRAMTAPPGYQDFAMGHIEVEHSPGSFNVLNLGSPMHDTMGISMLSPTGIPAHFIASGKVIYRDRFQTTPAASLFRLAIISTKSASKTRCKPERRWL